MVSGIAVVLFGQDAWFIAEFVKRGAPNWGMDAKACELLKAIPIKIPHRKH